MASPSSTSRTRSRRLAPYVALGLVVCALGLAQTVNRQWSRDYWQHQATVETFRDDVIDPPNEITRTHDPSVNYTPYTLVLAAVARVTGWAAVTVLQLAAIANLLLFLVTFELFVTELTRRRLAAFFALLATLFLWGIVPWRWSGLLNLNSIGFGLPYPSMFATGVAFGVGWALLRYIDSGWRRYLVGVGVGTVLVALSHPFTAVWMSVMLLALVVSRREAARDRLIPLALTAVAALVAIALWPYYSLFDLLRRGDDFSHVQVALFRGLPLRLLALLPGFYVVVRRFQRNHTDALALMLIGSGAIYAYGAATGNGNLGRVLPLVVLPAHIGIGILLADMFDHRSRPQPLLVAWIAISAAIGFAGVLPGLARGVPRAILPESLRDRTALQPITAPYGGLNDAVPAGTVVITQDSNLASVAAAYRMAVVLPGWPTPFVHDIAARRRDVRQFLDPTTTPARRREIEAHYGVDGVLCRDHACVTEFTAPESGGRVIAAGPSWKLVALPHG